MFPCSHPGCSWRTVTPSRETALDRYADHLLAVHAETVEADVPAGTIEVELRVDGERTTRSVEAAALLGGGADDESGH